MHHGHEVEAFADGERVPDLLIPTVALVVLVPQDGDPNLWMGLLILTPDLRRAVLRRIVDDEDFAVVLIENGPRYSLENGLQGRFGVVSDDEDEQPGLRALEHLNDPDASSRTAAFRAARAGARP